METEKHLIGVIALDPLPGSPGFDGDEVGLMARALEDADAYADAGLDGILIENSFDLPYIKPPLDSKGLQLFEEIAVQVRGRFAGPIGVQVLEAANEEALTIASRAQLDFIRVEGYVFAHVGGAGLIEGCAGKLQRLRRTLCAERVRIFGDVKKKHCAHAITGDLTLEDHVRQADFFLIDGVIVTGAHTGFAPDPEDLARARAVTKKPIWIGSGMTVDNLPAFFPLADGFIVGSAFRVNGDFRNRLQRARLQRFAEAFRDLKFARLAE